MRQFRIIFEETPYVVVELEDVVFLYPPTPVQAGKMDLTPRASLRQLLPDLHLEGREVLRSILPPAAGLDLTTEAGIRSAISLDHTVRPVLTDLIVPAATEATRD